MTRLKLVRQGGVGLRIRVYDRIICFVNCHLAAHLEAVNRRNADFDHIYRNMVFNRSSNLLNNVAGMVPYLFLSCSLAFSTYLFWLLYSSGLPLALSVAAGVSTAVHTLRATNVSLDDQYNSIFTYRLTVHSVYLFLVPRLLLSILKNQNLSYLMQTWLCFWVILITGSSAYHMMKHETLFLRDASTGLEKRISLGLR